MSNPLEKVTEEHVVTHAENAETQADTNIIELLNHSTDQNEEVRSNANPTPSEIVFGYHLTKNDGSPFPIKNSEIEETTGKKIKDVTRMIKRCGHHDTRVFLHKEDADKVVATKTSLSLQVNVEPIYDEHIAVLADSKSSKTQKKIADKRLEWHNAILEKQELQSMPGTDENCNLKKLEEKILIIEKSIKVLENERLDNEFTLGCLNENERGDAKLFVKLHGDKYVFDPTEGKSGAFYIWTDLQWELDLLKKRYEDFDDVAAEYLRVSEETQDAKLQDDLEKRTRSLRTDRRRRSVFETVSSMIPLKCKWDNFPGLLPCKNGIVELASGNLTDHDPQKYIRKVCPNNYNKDAECPNFKSFLKDISLGDDEWIGFLKRTLGYAIIGVPSEEIIICWYGDGRNGKGTLTDLLKCSLGPIVKTFPSEMLLSQRNPPSSSSPSPELANLEGVRIALFSEINKGRKIDSAKVKNLSGRDTISCRRLFSNIDLQIEPTYTIIFQTNHKPEAPADDKALWSRMVLMPFKASFVRNPNKENERPLDEKLKDRLKEEAEGILAWLVEGSMEYIAHGLNIPKSVLEFTEMYRKENDGIGHFLENRCIEAPEFSVQKEKMLNAIQEYCEKNGFSRPTRNDISDYLKNRFGEKRYKDYRYWKGVTIREETSHACLDSCHN